MIEEQARKLMSSGGSEGKTVVRLLDKPEWGASEDDYLPPVYIPKRNGGRRKIMEPKPYLKAAQKRIVWALVYWRYGPSPYAHGFVNKRGRRTNALPHIDHAHMLKVDIEDFFGSCAPEMVINALERLDPPVWFLRLVSRLCFLGRGLPQGSPASPMLSNIVAREMDFRLAGLCKSFRKGLRKKGDEIVYTRYADDLTFTSNWLYLREFVHGVGHVLGQCGFTVKQSKTKIFHLPARLESCGVVISEKKINARRRDRLYWRGRLHKMVVDIKFNGVPPGQFERKDGRHSKISQRMIRRVRGKIAAIVDISPQDKDSLFSKLRELQSLCGYTSKRFNTGGTTTGRWPPKKPHE